MVSLSLKIFVVKLTMSCDETIVVIIQAFNSVEQF